MTAKRFTLKGFDGVRCDLFDGDVELAEIHKEDAKELCNLLNELHEENQKCKEYNGILYANHTKTDRKLVKQISKLKQENEQLKLQYKELEISLLNNQLAYNDLEKENEQLKKQLQSEHQMLENAILLERTRMGKNSLKQYKEAIQ